MSIIYNNNDFNIIGRVTKDLAPLVKENNSGMKFLFFDLACQRGFGEDVVYINGLYMSGMRKNDGSYDNSNVENFVSKITTKHLAVYAGHFEGYTKNDGEKNSYVEVRRIDGFRVVSFPKSDYNAQNESPEEIDPLEM